MRNHAWPGVLAISLTAVLMGAGCTFRTAKVPAAPATPTPVSIKDPPPLVLAQTVAVLPAPQPVPPERIPPELPAAEPAVSEMTIQRPARRPPTAHPREPETSVTEVVPDQQRPVPVAKSVPALVSSDSNEASRSDIERRMLDVQTRIARIGPRQPSKEMSMTRISKFLELSRSALDRNDLRQADLLSKRALILIQDLER